MTKPVTDLPLMWTPSHFCIFIRNKLFCRLVHNTPSNYTPLGRCNSYRMERKWQGQLAMNKQHPAPSSTFIKTIQSPSVLNDANHAYASWKSIFVSRRQRPMQNLMVGNSCCHYWSVKFWVKSFRLSPYSIKFWGLDKPCIYISKSSFVLVIFCQYSFIWKMH